MRRAVVAMILIALAAGSAFRTTPSEAAKPTVQPASSANDGIYVWGDDNVNVRPATGLVHFPVYQFGDASTTSIVGFTGSLGPQSVEVTIGSNGGPPLATGTQQLPVYVFTDHGCQGTAWIAIDDLAFDGNGNPTRLATHFTVACVNRPGNSITVSAMLDTSVGEPAHDISRIAMIWSEVYQAPLRGLPVTISNPSGTPLPIQSVNSSTTAFAVTDDGCSGHVVAPGGSCTLRVGPHPNGPLGPHSASLQIVDGMSSVSGHGASIVPLYANFPTPPQHGRHWLVDTTTFPRLPSGTYPIVGDYDGNGTDDIFWYGPGSVTDTLWLSDAERTFDDEPERVTGNYEPFVGDFDGSGRDAIFWYAPGPASDTIWYDAVDHTGYRTLQVNGNYQPIVDDFNGDGIDDIIWWAPGPTPDFIWYGQRNRTFVQRPLTINGNYQYLDIGDFNGDGRPDILWWNPGVISHPLWLGAPNGGFTNSHMDSPAPDSFPMFVNADDDGRLDVLWYGAGPVADALELSSAHYAPQPLTINGDYQELWGTFDGNNENLTDILWWANTPSAPPDPFWEANGHGFTAVANTEPHVDPTRYFPIMGDFQAGPLYGYGAYGGIDILWANDANYDDPPIMWWSYDVDGTSNPAPMDRIRHPFRSPAAKAFQLHAFAGSTSRVAAP